MATLRFKRDDSGTHKATSAKGEYSLRRSPHIAPGGYREYWEWETHRVSPETGRDQHLSTDRTLKWAKWSAQYFENLID